MSKENQENQETSVSSEDTQDITEQQSRFEALGHAVRHRLSSETPYDVVKAAEKYLAFLQDAK